MLDVRMICRFDCEAFESDCSRRVSTSFKLDMEQIVEMDSLQDWIIL